MVVGSKTELHIGEAWDAASIVSIPDLQSGNVHLWKRRLHASASDVSTCYEMLSGDEQDRARRFRIDRPRHDFVLSRGTLRWLLAQYLRISPLQVRFRYGSHGKPVLENDRDLRFNVSHTEGLAHLGRNADAVRLAERFFSAREYQELRRLQGNELQAAFFRCWTRKEAYIKARGEGLSLPLRQFDVSVAKSDCNALIATRPDPAEAARWRICEVAIDPGYAAALAVANTIEDTDQ